MSKAGSSVTVRNSLGPSEASYRYILQFIYTCMNETFRFELTCHVKKKKQ